MDIGQVFALIFAVTLGFGVLFVTALHFEVGPFRPAPMPELTAEQRERLDRELAARFSEALRR